ncbi:MAG: hypothetical protein ACLVLH_27685 [Eisenbergiella massiliensis]
MTGLNGDVQTTDRTELFRALWEGDTETAENDISDLFNSISYHDYMAIILRLSRDYLPGGLYWNSTMSMEMAGRMFHQGKTETPCDA